MLLWCCLSRETACTRSKVSGHAEAEPSSWCSALLHTFMIGSQASGSQALCLSQSSKNACNMGSRSSVQHACLASVTADAGTGVHGQDLYLASSKPKACLQIWPGSAAPAWRILSATIPAPIVPPAAIAPIIGILEQVCRVFGAHVLIVLPVPWHCLLAGGCILRQRPAMRVLQCVLLIWWQAAW